MTGADIPAFVRLPEVPDFLGKDARIDAVAETIQAGQQQVQRLRNEMTLNGRTADQEILVPNAVEGEVIPSYQERFDTVEAGINQLVADLIAEFPDDDKIHERLVAVAVKKREQLMQRLDRANS